MRRTEALRMVQIYGFAVFDTALFLDTHPMNREALTFLRAMREKYREAVTAFEREFGPLNIGSSGAENNWDWVDGPWPWEVEQ